MTGIRRADFIFLSALTLASQSMPSSAAAQYNPVQSKTFLINGLVSAIPFIGYGMANLKKRIGGASLYSYVSPIEGTAFIQPKIIREIRSLHRRNRDIKINLIGISYGASIVTAISAILSKDDIPVNYLGVIDGRPLTKVHSNVRRVDNFTCSFIDCIGARLKLARGNNSTRQVSFKFRSTHISLGNNNDLHNRVIQQISRTTYTQYAQPKTTGIDNMPVAAIR